jgi:hypothetical protein
VAGGFSPAQVIIIHGGKIIMDQRISVDQLQGTGERQDISDPPTYRFNRSDGQDGPEALSAREEAVTHRPMNPGRKLILVSNPTLQGCIDPALAALEVFP